MDMRGRHAVAFINTNAHKHVMRELTNGFPDCKFEFVNPQYLLENQLRPFYDSYLFMNWDGDTEDYGKFEEKSGNIIKFLRTGDSLKPVLYLLLQDEVANLQDLEKNYSNFYDSFKNHIGETVTFKDGLFKDHEGILQKVNSQKGKGHVIINLFNNKIPATVNLEDILVPRSPMLLEWAN